MMQSKSFLEKFYKFEPTNEQYELLNEIYDYEIKLNKELRIIEAKIAFSSPVPKDKLYKLEKDIEKAYELNKMKLLPQYPECFLTYEYIPQILIEAETIGIVAKGFFSHYTYEFDESSLEISIPFSKNGVMLLEDASTPKIIENIIFSEFGKHVNVNIKHTRDDDDNGYSEYMQRELAALDKHLQTAEAEYERHQSQAQYSSHEEQASEPEKPSLPRI